MRQFSLRPTSVGLSLLALLLLMASPARTQSEEPIGSVAAIVGQGTILRQGRVGPEPLAVRTPVFQQEIIETAAASKVAITLTDGTAISLGERSRLELTHFSHEARQQTYTARLRILSGLFRTIVRKLTPQSVFEVGTPTAVAAIRGTDLMGEVTADSTAIVVLDGTVMVSHARPGFDGPVTLIQGMGTTVKGDEPPSAPKRWSDSRIEALRTATAVP